MNPERFARHSGPTPELCLNLTQGAVDGPQRAAERQSDRMAREGEGEPA